MPRSVNKVRQRIQEGKTAFGVGIHFREPAIVEMAGLAGFDAVFIDMETSALELGQVEELIRAADAVGTTPLVRVPDLDPTMIRRVLDLGALAITIPHVRTKREAEQAVQATRYQPAGERGVSPFSRAAGYGAVAWEAHTQSSNKDIVLTVDVEDREGLENIEEIASVKGLDIVAIGPSDLAESLGIRQANDPKLRTVVENVARALKRVGNAKMAFPYRHRLLDATYRDLKEWGVCYSNVNPSIERVLLLHFQGALAALREDMETVNPRASK